MPNIMGGRATKQHQEVYTFMNNTVYISTIILGRACEKRFFLLFIRKVINKLPMNMNDNLIWNI